MKYITAASENRIMKSASKDDFGFWASDDASILAAILDNIKASYGWCGVTISEAKKMGQRFENYDQVSGFSHRESVLYGWSVRFPELVSYSNTLETDVLTIYDFNGLVKAVLEN